MVQRDFDYIYCKRDKNNIKRYYLNGVRIPGKRAQKLVGNITW